MSHPLVAAVWEQLGRRDLENILHEIIGEHAVNLAVCAAQYGYASNTEPLTRSVLWIQILFNLQRTYLQGLTSVRDCHPYFSHCLISSEVIFSTLMYLTKVKVELFPCTQPTTPEHLRYRHLVAHTFLVGIRLLILRGDSITPEKKFRLERAMRSAWEHPDLSGSERFLINDLLPRSIDSTGTTDLFRTQQSLLQSSKSYLPTFAGGIYPFPGAPETLTTDLLTSLMRNNKDDQLTSFYLLFDLLWAAESASIQCHIDRRRISQEQGYTSAAALKVDEAFNQTQDNKKKVARTVLAAFDDEFNTPSLQVLATVILSQTAGDHSPLQTRKIRDTWTQLASIREFTDSSLGLLMRWLINRRVQLWDCNGELEAFSHDYQKHLTQWLHNSSPLPSNHQAQVKKGSTGAVYVVDCPAVHPVPEALLEEQLRTSDRRAHEQLQDKSRLLTMDVLCPLCPGSVRIQHARMIEPLEQISDALHSTESEGSGYNSFPDSVSRNTTSRSSSRSNSTGQLSRDDSMEALTRSPISPISQTSSFFKLTSKTPTPTTSESLNPFLTRPRTGQSHEKQLIRSLSKDLKNVTLSIAGTNLFRRGSSKGHHLPRQPRFCFSASGRSLLLWDAGNSWVTRFELDSTDGRRPRGHRYDVSGVQHAAAGYQRCAVVASAGEHYELLVFGSNSITPEAYSTIETQHRYLPITCMVMSRDDRYVAFTLKDQIRVYEIIAGGIREIQLGDKGDRYSVLRDSSAADAQQTTGHDVKRVDAVIARKLQFSVDGKYFIVATHHGDQYAYLDVWNCTEARWTLEVHSSSSFKLPPWTSEDGDLTSVFYNSLNQAVVLTAFLGKEYPVSFTVSSEAVTSDPVSPRIVHAAQSPSGSRFVMVNGMKQMYLCDSTASGSFNPTRLKKGPSKISPSVFRPGQLALSFPDDDEVFAFWVKDGKLMLRVINLHGGGENTEDHDLRSDFDRLVVERPPATDLYRQRHPSSLSRQILVEMDGLQSPIPRPDLPELPAT